MKSLPAFALLVVLAFLSPASAAEIASARFTEPTNRYPHNVLGHLKGFGALEVRLTSGETLQMVLPQNRVFEDIEPRLWDVDADGKPEIVAVESDVNEGARLTAWTVSKTGAISEITLRAAGSFIGTRFRWLAPAGIADFTGNGRLEIAYVAMPHLVRELVLVQLEGEKFVPIARKSGFSNHKIGQPFITGVLQTCAQGPVLYLPSADWQNIMAVSYANGALQARLHQPLGTLKDFDHLPACKN